MSDQETEKSLTLNYLERRLKQTMDALCSATQLNDRNYYFAVKATLETDIQAIKNNEHRTQGTVA